MFHRPGRVAFPWWVLARSVVTPGQDRLGSTASSAPGEWARSRARGTRARDTGDHHQGEGVHLRVCQRRVVRWVRARRMLPTSLTELLSRVRSRPTAITSTRGDLPETRKEG